MASCERQRASWVYRRRRKKKTQLSPIDRSENNKDELGLHELSITLRRK
jgi:hypothetical protein